MYDFFLFKILITNILPPESAEAAAGAVYTYGSRIEARTVAATITKAEYLGRYATVMDVAMLAVAMGWELGGTVIADSDREDQESTVRMTQGVDRRESGSSSRRERKEDSMGHRTQRSVRK